MIDFRVGKKGIALFSGSPALSSLLSDKGIQGPKPTVLAKSNDEARNTKKWYSWGDDNDLPKSLITQARSASILSRSLEYRAESHFGLGPFCFRWKVQESTGSLYRETIIDPTIQAFWERHSIDTVQAGIVQDYEFHKLSFVEVQLSNDRKSIFRIYKHKAAHCRFENSSGLPENVLISKSWPNPKDEQISTLPIWTPQWDIEKYPQSFVIVISHDDLINELYPFNTWSIVLEQGWVDLVKAIPLLKKAILKNQFTLKYHVMIPQKYWSAKYPDWDKRPDYDDKKNEAGEVILESKRTLKDAFYDSMEDYLAGAENSGKAFFQEYVFDPATQTKIAISIEPLDDKLKDGKYLEDSFAANTEILWAVGVNPNVIGVVPGGSMGAGSGSNIREAYWADQSTNGIARTFTLKWLYIIKMLENWDSTIKFGYLINDTIQTLNDSKSKSNVTSL